MKYGHNHSMYDSRHCRQWQVCVDTKCTCIVALKCAWQRQASIHIHHRRLCRLYNIIAAVQLDLYTIQCIVETITVLTSSNSKKTITNITHFVSRHIRLPILRHSYVQYLYFFYTILRLHKLYNAKGPNLNVMYFFEDAQPWKVFVFLLEEFFMSTAVNSALILK
jgi:hypothetical protein